MITKLKSAATRTINAVNALNVTSLAILDKWFEVQKCASTRIQAYETERVAMRDKLAQTVTQSDFAVRAAKRVLRQARGADRETAKASLEKAIATHAAANVALARFDKRYLKLSTATDPVGTVALVTPPSFTGGELGLRTRVQWRVQAGWVQKVNMLIDQNHVTEWRGRTPRTAVLAKHICAIPCYAVVARNGALLQHQILNKISIRFAPAGYIWVTDSNGVALANDGSRQDRYHLDSHQITTEPDSWLVKKVDEARNVRLRSEAQSAVDEADIKGVKVGFQDSIDAGNCNAGTRAWADRHKIDITRKYDASELLQIAEHDDLGRVRLVIRQAIIRSRKEAEEQAALARIDATELARLETMASEVAAVEQATQNATAEIDAATADIAGESASVATGDVTAESAPSIPTSIESGKAA